MKNRKDTLRNFKKFLITGTLAFIVTACGGGGGGSSATVKNTNPSNVDKISNKPKKENNSEIKKPLELPKDNSKNDMGENRNNKKDKEKKLEDKKEENKKTLESAKDNSKNVEKKEKENKVDKKEPLELPKDTSKKNMGENKNNKKEENKDKNIEKKPEIKKEKSPEIQEISNEIEKLNSAAKSGLKEIKERLNKLGTNDVKTKEDISNLIKSLSKIDKINKDNNEDAIAIFGEIYSLIEVENPNFTKMENIDNYLKALTIEIEDTSTGKFIIRKRKLSENGFGILPYLKNRIDKITKEDIKSAQDIETLDNLLKEVEEMLKNEETKNILEVIPSGSGKLIDKVKEMENKLKKLKEEAKIENKELMPRALQYSAGEVVQFEAIPLEKIEDKVPTYLKETAKVWDKLDEDPNTTQEIKDIIKKLKEDDYKNIEEKMKELYPSMYSNLAREIFSKNKLFNEKDREVIDTLNGNQYGFILLNEYKDVKEYNHIDAYRTKQSGFVGSVNFGNNLYGNIGYGHDDVKHKGNGKETIQTIHLGLNKNQKIDKIDLDFALSGEYNFHKNTREMKNFDKIAKAKFNSYSLGTSAKISQKFGESLYVKPFSKIELAYIKHEGFTEKDSGALNIRIKEQAYTSILPQVGFELGKSFSNLNLFADLTYGYELGNLNKAEEFSYEFEKSTTTKKLVKDDLEKTRFIAKVGANYQKENFSLGVNLGQDFNKRGNKFVNFSLGYKF